VNAAEAESVFAEIRKDLAEEQSTTLDIEWTIYRE
jgi:hypothetical protein